MGPDDDINAPALALASLFKLPLMESLAWRHDLDITPSRIEIGGLARLDRRILFGPEAVGVAK